ncbi:MAG: hypothetical protein SV775_10245 [Thermodesulfobacteriota bacterium]|nr:hypothetical protein [Thermodesulfobacteriota bacterium]
MTKREKMILFVMFLAVLYGVYALFLSTPSKPALVDAGEESKKLNKLIADVSVSLSKDNLTEINTQTIAMAEAEWFKDPFAEIEVSVIRGQNGELRAFDADPYRSILNYSGYLEVGGERIAIVNGSEYLTGDLMEKDGYIVREIHPSEVVLEIIGEQEKITVPLVEETSL